MNKLAIILFIAGVVIPALFFLYRFLLQLTTKPVLEISLTPSDNPGWSRQEKNQQN